MACVLSYKSVEPKIDPSVFLAPNAVVVGDVTLGEGANVWFNTIIRGDMQPIKIGKYTNVQDGTTIHVMGDHSTVVGDYVTLGHNAIIHCASIGNNCLIGMGSVLLGYTEIGDNCVIGANTLITQYKKIPPNSMVYGNPAKIIRSLREDEIEALHLTALRYNAMAQEYMKSLK